MANSKKSLAKANAKFRKNESQLYKSVSDCISYLADFIKRSGATEATVIMKNGKSIEVYANS